MNGIISSHSGSRIAQLVLVFALLASMAAATERKIYWTDSDTNMIRRANLDGSEVEDVVAATSPYFGIAVAVDSAAGKVYWMESDWILDPAIVRRANLDGTDVEDVVVSISAWNLVWDMALDAAGGKVYWSDADEVYRANLDGSDVEDITRTSGTIALDLVSRKVYWGRSSWGARWVTRANLDGSDSEGVISIESVWGSVYQIALDLTVGMVYWASGEEALNRAEFGASTFETLLCGEIVDDLALDVAHGKVYWLSTEDGVIRRANLDGTAIEDVLTGLGSPLAMYLEPDCNGNDVPDHIDIADLTSSDCSGNGVPDECELDCNDNGFADSCDIHNGTSTDCDANSIPDECESVYTDCNNNDISDFCDVESGSSDDCNENDVPDDCEPDGDCNDNGVSDLCDIGAWDSRDCNANSIPDECDISAGTSLDCNTNGRPDECEPDCNDNGVTDECDIDTGTSSDCNDNEIPDDCEPDCNENGIADDCDIAAETSPDCDSNGIPDECESAEDCNSNGIQDFCDIAGGSSTDCDNNGVPDDCEPYDDCNTNGVNDLCDLDPRASGDCNSNGIPDDCDISAGTSTDTDGNGIPDECFHVNDDHENAQVICEDVVPDRDRGYCAGTGFIRGDPVCGGWCYGRQCSVTAQDCEDGSECRSWGSQIPYRCVVTTDNRLATTDGADPGCGCADSAPGSFQADVWYKLPWPPVTPECRYHMAIIDLRGADPDYDPMLALYARNVEICPGAGGDEDLRACNDDSQFGDGKSSGLSTWLNWQYLQNYDYWIRVGGWSSSGDLSGASRGVGELDITILCRDYEDDTCLDGPWSAFGEHEVAKNRYISFNPFSGLVGYRVDLLSMLRCSEELGRACSDDGDCPDGTGTCVEHPDVGSVVGWVSKPFDPSCQSGPGEPPTGDCAGVDLVSRIVQEAVYRTWSWSEYPIHVADCEIVPAATYGIGGACECSSAVWGDTLEIGTIAKPSDHFYGDTVGVGTGDLRPLPGFTPPNGIVNVNDVTAYLLTVQGDSTPSAHWTWVDLHGMGEGAPPNCILNVSDLQRILFGLEGKTYTETSDQLNPMDCP